VKIQPSQLNASIRDIPLPDNMRELPVSRQGYPVPFFVARETAPDWDFRVVRPDTFVKCVRQHLCWICGQTMGTKKAFVVGPMCVITRTSAEPPCHLSCAEYAAIACPFLAQPRMKRNEVDLPEGHQLPAGEAIMRNPGVSAVLVTRGLKIFNDGNGRALVQMGRPDEVKWYAQRRAATRKEVMDSIESGLPLLFEQCQNEKSAMDKVNAHRELSQRVTETMRWVPDDETAPPLEAMRPGAEG
jgi:hypothetical protein